MKLLRLRMGTRGSPLALAQAGQIAEKLRRAFPDTEIETVIIRTSGDKFGSVPPKEARSLSQGVKGLFVKEIEEVLSSDRIDFAVHSAKDLPAALAPGLHICAYPPREDARDVFIGRPGISWNRLPARAKIGTSSLRRKIQLLEASPHAEIVPMRGNIDTRIKKLGEGAADGIILAAAGLHRLGLAHVSHEALPVEVLVPSPGQGALAVETRLDDDRVSEIIGRLDDGPTRLAVECERSFLAAAGGGCSTPLGAFAQALKDGLSLRVFWSREDGSASMRFHEKCPDPSRSVDFARTLAGRLRSH